MRSNNFLITFLFLTSVIVGCGDYHGATVSGVVTLDGEPFPSDSKGTVVYLPDSGGPPAVGRLDANSRYQLATGSLSSLVPGEYSVTVNVNAPPASLHSKDGGPSAAGKLLVPHKYRTKRTSGLQFTVEPGSNTIDLELQSKG